MSVVGCVTLDGHKTTVQQDSLVLRPAVYALIVQDDAAGKPQWVDIQSVNAQDFQAHEEIILDLYRNLAS